MILWSFASLLFLSAGIYGFAPKPDVSPKTIKWYTLEEALEANEKDNKKIVIDMYTEWCKWCKVMDQKTFTDPKVISYLNDHYYAVKFDAEQKEPITFKGKKYEYMKAGRRGIHMLAYQLLEGKASYPSFVVLNEQLETSKIIKGYKTPEQFLELLESKITR